MLVCWVNIGMMENQMEKKMENEMETGIMASTLMGHQTLRVS